jgi:hypothetical protein
MMAEKIPLYHLRKPSANTRAITVRKRKSVVSSALSVYTFIRTVQ